MALVGYTNVGKSTLINLLAKTDVFAENKLFATLDTTVRKVIIDNLPFLLADTVGFIRKLPTDLVESFKSTLDEVREADLLVHVVDVSHPDFMEQIEVVNNTLRDLGCAEKPQLLVFNKMDAYTWTEKDPDDLTPATRENVSLDELKHTWMAKMGDDCIFISARERQNIDELKELFYARVKQLHVQKYPYNDFCSSTTSSNKLLRWGNITVTGGRFPVAGGRRADFSDRNSVLPPRVAPPLVSGNAHGQWQ